MNELCELGRRQRYLLSLVQVCMPTEGSSVPSKDELVL